MLLLLATMSDAALLLGPYLSILAGCLGAFLLHQPQYFAWFVSRMSVPLLSVMVILVLLPVPASFHPRGIYQVSYPLLIGLTLAGLAATRSLPFLDAPLAQWIGKRSYAIYLFHILMIRLVVVGVERLLPVSGEIAALTEFVLATASVFIVAAILHRYFEEPLIQFGRKMSTNLVRRTAVDRDDASVDAQ
jgi:peptidoglycan/LPS O-acetylase OafA/YrhL